MPDTPDTCSEPTRCTSRDKAECEWCQHPTMPDTPDVDALVDEIVSVFQHAYNPETDEWELAGDLDQHPAYRALTTLATLARRAATTDAEQLVLADAMAEAFGAIKCNLDPVDSGCDDPCHMCSLMKAHKVRDAYRAAREAVK